MLDSFYQPPERFTRQNIALIDELLPPELHKSGNCTIEAWLAAKVAARYVIAAARQTGRFDDESLAQVADRLKDRDSPPLTYWSNVFADRELYECLIKIGEQTLAISAQPVACVEGAV